MMQLLQLLACPEHNLGLISIIVYGDSDWISQWNVTAPEVACQWRIQGGTKGSKPPNCYALYLKIVTMWL